MLPNGYILIAYLKFKHTEREREKPYPRHKQKFLLITTAVLNSDISKYNVDRYAMIFCSIYLPFTLLPHGFLDANK